MFDKLKAFAASALALARSHPKATIAIVSFVAGMIVGAVAF